MPRWDEQGNLLPGSVQQRWDEGGNVITAAPPPAAATQPSKPGIISRFTGSLYEGVGLPANPAEWPSDLAKGAKEMVTHPIDTGKLLLESIGEGVKQQYKTASEQFKQPGLVPKLRAAQTAIPVIGSGLNKAGEQFEKGDIAGGAGSTVAAATQVLPAAEAISPGATANAAANAARLARPVVATAGKVAGAAVEPVANLAGKASARNWEQVLGATTKKLKAISSEKLIPELQKRGITANTREGLSKVAAEGVATHGAEVDAAIQRHTASGVQLQTDPLIADLQAIKQRYTLRSAASGKITARRSAPIAKITEAQNILRKYGKTIRPDDLVKVRRFLDDSVAKKKMAFLADDTKGFEGEAEEAASNSLRSRINEEFPDLEKANEDFSFHKNLQTVVDATLQRTASQSRLMGRALKGATGAYIGSQLGRLVGSEAAGGVVGASADLLHDTAAYRTRAAGLESSFASRFGTRPKTPFQRTPRPSIKVWPQGPGGGGAAGRAGGPTGGGGGAPFSSTVSGGVVNPQPSPFARPAPARLSAAPKQLAAGPTVVPRETSVGPSPFSEAQARLQKLSDALKNAPPAAGEPLTTSQTQPEAKPKLFIGKELASKLAKQGFTKDDLAVLSPEELDRIKTTGETRERRSAPRTEAFSAVAFEKFLERKGLDREKFSALSDQEKGDIIGEFGSSGTQSIQGMQPAETKTAPPFAKPRLVSYRFPGAMAAKLSKALEG